MPIKELGVFDHNGRLASVTDLNGYETRLAYDLSSLRQIWHLAEPCPDWLKQVWIDWLGPERIFELAIDGDGKAKPLTTKGLSGSAFTLSHDGLTIAVGVDQKLMLLSMAGGDDRILPGSKPNDIPIEWTDDNSALFILERMHTAVRVVRIDVTSGERREWVTIRPGDPAGILDVMPVHITPDGQSYAYGYRRFLSDLFIATSLQ